MDLLLKPLLGRIEEEVKHDGTAATGRLSKVNSAVAVHLSKVAGQFVYE